MLGLDFLAICFSLIAITDREIDENSYSYYIALVFYGLTHVIFLANSFMEDSNTTNLPARLLKNENFQLLAFVIIFWFSWPWMWSTYRERPTARLRVSLHVHTHTRAHFCSATPFFSPSHIQQPTAYF